MSKVGIVGAGAVGSAMAYACLIRRSARSIVLHDIDRAKVEAEVLDLAQGALYTGASQVEGGPEPEVLAGCDVLVVTAGAKQKPGQSRLDLAAANAAMLEDLVPVLTKVAPEAVLVLVTNPCDVLTLVAQRLSGLPRSRVLSSGTMLDTSRLRVLLARRAGVLPASIHATIIGEHGDSELPVWSQARIGPVPLLAWPGPPPFTPAELEQVADEVRQAAYRIIRGKGATSYAIGLAGARLVEAILRDENAILPVSSVQAGPHGFHDVAFSLPSVVNAQGVARVLDLDLTEEENRALEASVAALRHTERHIGA